MILFGKSMATDVAIVAEISGNHGGDINNAIRLIELAKTSGADAVKIQLYKPEEMVADKNFALQDGPWKGRKLFELYSKNATPYEWIDGLVSAAGSIGIPIFPSVFSPNTIAQIECSTWEPPAYKISAFESNDKYLVHRAVKTGKRVIVSSSEVTWGLELESLQCYKDKIVVLHCTSSYPTERDQANLWRISYLKRAYDYVGYSDHNKTLITAQLAVGAGACVIERHITIGGDTDDKEFSLNPGQFNLYTKCIRLAQSSMRHEALPNVHGNLRRSIYATRDIKKGECFSLANCATFRGRPPGLGVYEAQDFPDVLSCKAAGKLRKGELITAQSVGERVQND